MYTDSEQQSADARVAHATMELNNKNQKELEYYDKLHHQKYRDENQTKQQHAFQLASTLASDFDHKNKLYSALYWNRFLPAGRVQAALGATEREVSPFNCSVSQRIDDCIDSIMSAQSNAVKILRLGTGIGYNFSHLRPKGAEIKKLKTEASGPLSFMEGFNVYAATIASAGHRRGAMMGILNVDHPDIEAFIDSKMVEGALRQFNISVGITDPFMAAVSNDEPWTLQFEGKVYKEIPARYLWEKIIKNAYDSAEPGIIFIDRLNDTNNLWYCETIEATNPCSEQPLPPYGLCMLGSFNLPAYLYHKKGELAFNQDVFVEDIHAVVEAYDNIFDKAIYAIPEHREEAIAKRRMGLGLTGIANAIELLMGIPSYGSESFCLVLDDIAKTLRNHAYAASIKLAQQRGAFPMFDKNKYMASEFITSLPDEINKSISKHGIRNSHLISYAPCGTISQTAWNVSSGVEPVFYHEMSRDVYMRTGKENVTTTDFAYREYNFKGKTLAECSIEDHLKVTEICQKYCDSAVSKTINVSPNCSYQEYETVYLQAYSRGLKGITVYRPTPLRGVVIKALDKPKEEPVEEQLELPLEMPKTSCVNGLCER
jgi:ribonucleoside-diphosphate reductase alpha chain